MARVCRGGGAGRGRLAADSDLWLRETMASRGGLCDLDDCVLWQLYPGSSCAGRSAGRPAEGKGWDVLPPGRRASCQSWRLCDPVGPAPDSHRDADYALWQL